MIRSLINDLEEANKLYVGIFVTIALLNLYLIDIYMVVVLLLSSILLMFNTNIQTKHTYATITIITIMLASTIAVIKPWKEISLTYETFSTYDHDDDWSNIYVNYESLDNLRTLSYEDYGYNKLYMKLNKCEPVLAKATISYWFNSEKVIETIRCRKDVPGL